MIYNLKEESTSLGIELVDFCYLLGLVKSDGTLNQEFIYVEMKSKQLMEDIARFHGWSFYDTSKLVNGVFRNYYAFRVPKMSEINTVFVNLNCSDKSDNIDLCKSLASEEEIIQFLRGYFDGDGSIFQVEGSWCMDFCCNINEVGLIAMLLHRIGIDANVHYCSSDRVANMELRINNQSNIVSLASKFYNAKYSYTLLDKRDTLLSIERSNKLSFDEEVRLRDLIKKGKSIEELEDMGFSRNIIKNRMNIKVDRTNMKLFYEYLSEGSLTESQIVSLLNISRTTFYNRVQKALIEGFKVDSRYIPVRHMLTKKESEELNRRIIQGENCKSLCIEYKVSRPCIISRIKKLKDAKILDDSYQPCWR